MKKYCSTKKNRKVNKKCVPQLRFNRLTNQKSRFSLRLSCLLFIVVAVVVVVFVVAVVACNRLCRPNPLQLLPVSSSHLSYALAATALTSAVAHLWFV